MILNTLHSALRDRRLVFHHSAAKLDKQICYYHDYHAFIIAIIING